MISCCIPLSLFSRREPNPAPPPEALPPEWADYVKDRPPIVISPEISGEAGPLTIAPAWLDTQGRSLMVDEQDHLRAAIRAMEGHELLAGANRFPHKFSGQLSLCDGREVTYVHTAQKSKWNGKDWIAPGDEHQPRFVSRQIIKIAVFRHGERLAQIDSNPVFDIPQDDKAITPGCRAHDNDSRVSLENDSDAATRAATRQCGYRLNVCSDGHARAADMYGWRP